MVQSKQTALIAALDAIEKRWGAQAVKTATEMQTVSVVSVSTGIPALDAILTHGGIARGQITQIYGGQTSGMGTLALKIISSAQADGGRAVYLDLSQIFDPIYATACGVNLADLLIVRPPDLPVALDIAAELVSRYRPDILVLGESSQRLTPEGGAALQRLVNSVRRSSCAFIALSRSAASAKQTTQPYASTEITLKRTRWLHSRGILTGYQVSSEVTRQNGVKPAAISLRLDLCDER